MFKKQQESKDMDLMIMGMIFAIVFALAGIIAIIYSFVMDGSLVPAVLFAVLAVASCFFSYNISSDSFRQQLSSSVDEYLNIENDE